MSEIEDGLKRVEGCSRCKGKGCKGGL